jgi:hypothetical protein
LINKKNELIHDIENNVKPRRNSVVVTLEKLPQSATLNPSVAQLILHAESCLSFSRAR